MYIPQDQSANVTITVTDVNDNPPMFEKDVYTWELPEEEPVAADEFEVRIDYMNYVQL